MKKTVSIIAVLVCIAPIVYLLVIYPQLSDTVPTHFNASGQPDDWSSKKSFLWMMAGLSVFMYLIYLLLCNVYRIDPKKKAFENKGRLQKIGFAIVLFMAAVQTWIIYSTQHGSTTQEPKFIFVAVGILFAIIGNYMDNIKPNYFAGLRLPWTLESEDNWRKTHHYASRIWFIGGLVIAACSLLLPFTIALVILFTCVLIMVLLPAIYSYQLYKKNKQNLTT